MNEVERYYDQCVEYEWERLERHRTEFAVTLRTLQEYLPPPPITILDIGGGPGRYAIALAQQDYEVTLMDLSKNLLDFAKEMEVELARQRRCIATRAPKLQPIPAPDSARLAPVKGRSVAVYEVDGAVMGEVDRIEASGVAIGTGDQYFILIRSRFFYLFEL